MDLLSLLTSSVSHEQITPLKCIIAFGNQTLQINGLNKAVSEKLKLIVSTATLVLNQVKMLLDKNMIDRNYF